MEVQLRGFKSFDVEIMANGIHLHRYRHDGTDRSLTYETQYLMAHDECGTFLCLPENIQADIKSAIELLTHA